MQWKENATYYGAHLAAAVANGSVPQSRLDDMAHRVLLPMYALGLIDDPVNPALQVRA